jgi:hypothetical protein
MVKKRMAMRMVTIFVALIVCGMFFPGLARGATGDSPLSTDKYTVEFKDLQLNEESSIPVKITNMSDAPLTLIPQFSSEGDCQFGYEYPGSDVSWIIHLAARDSLDITFTYTPSNYDECGAEFVIIDTVGTVLATIDVTGILEEVTEDPKTFETIDIGGFPTSVVDRLIDEHTNSTLQQMIDYCKDEFERHDQRRGKLVRCIAWTTGELLRAGKIEKEEMLEFRKAAAKVEWQTMIQEMRARRETRKSSRGNGRFWWLCRDK